MRRLFLLAFCTSAIVANSLRAEETFIPSAGFKEIRVLFVLCDQDGSPASGKVGHNEFSLKRSQDPDAPLRVNISNDYAMGTEDDAVGSVWMAASVASMLSVKPLNGYDLTLRFYGPSGGPSAGGVYCLNFLSALMRQEFPEDVVMTGTITPDGSIGPVGGIPYKLWAARKAGYKRAIIPLFSTPEIFKNPETGKEETVDPAELGRSLGLDVKPVETIAEAYEWLYVLPLQKTPKALPPVRYSASIEAALRKDSEALSKTLQSVISSEGFTKHYEAISKEKSEFSTTYTTTIEGARAALTEPASLLSARHATLTEWIPNALALENWLPRLEEFIGTSPSRENVLESTEKILRELKDGASKQIVVPSNKKWTELQISPEISQLAVAVQTSLNEGEDLQSLSDEDLRGRYAESLLALASQQQAKDLDPFTNVISVLGTQSASLQNPDASSLRNLLKMLLTTIQASVKTAQTTGLQRKNETEAQPQLNAAYRMWVGIGKGLEQQSRFVSDLAEQAGSSTSLIRGCYKAMDVMADSSAAFVVFDTIQAEGSLDDKKAIVVNAEGWPALQISNPSYASRILSGARKNAEVEIGKLLLRSESVVMPIYHYELGEHHSKFGSAGAGSADNVYLTLSSYYKAYLYAWLMNVFLDMEEGKFI